LGLRAEGLESYGFAGKSPAGRQHKAARIEAARRCEELQSSKFYPSSLECHGACILAESIKVGLETLCLGRAGRGAGWKRFWQRFGLI